MPLAGYCQTGCVDNGMASPSLDNPPKLFGFTGHTELSGPQLMYIILVPNTAPPQLSFSITGTANGTAMQVGGTWSSGNLAAFLGITAALINPLGALLPVTMSYDPGATGFTVFQMTVGGWNELQGPANPRTSPLQNIEGPLPIGSWILAFLNTGTMGQPTWEATMNSSAIFVGIAASAKAPEVRAVFI